MVASGLGPPSSFFVINNEFCHKMTMTSCTRATGRVRRFSSTKTRKRTTTIMYHDEFGVWTDDDNDHAAEPSTPTATAINTPPTPLLGFYTKQS
jgi:hypothetical protein